MKHKDLVYGLLTLTFTPITLFLCLFLGYNIGKNENKAEITELKTELKQAKAQIKTLEENQVIVYYADSYGGNP